MQGLHSFQGKLNEIRYQYITSHVLQIDKHTLRLHMLNFIKQPLMINIYIFIHPFNIL